MMIYRIFHPTLELVDIVDYYWYTKVALTDTMVQHYAAPLLEGLAFNLSRWKEYHQYDGQTVCLDQMAYLFGQPKSSRTITHHGKTLELVGVKLKPLGIARITGVNIEQLANKIIPAEDIWGNKVTSLCEAMWECNGIEAILLRLEKFLIGQYRKTSLHHRIESVAYALSLIHTQQGNISMQDVQNYANVTKKTLERAFMHYTGLSPKFYARLVRFNHAKQFMSMGSKLDIMDIACRLGYFDHSHFTADFKCFAGQTPTAYYRSKQESESGRTIPVS